MYIHLFICVILVSFNFFISEFLLKNCILLYILYFTFYILHCTIYNLLFTIFTQDHSLSGDVQFLLFDDQKVRPLGGWEDVKKECLKSFYQPVLLLYELEDSKESKYYNSENGSNNNDDNSKNNCNNCNNSTSNNNKAKRDNSDDNSKNNNDDNNGYRNVKNNCNNDHD